LTLATLAEATKTCSTCISFEFQTSYRFPSSGFFPVLPSNYQDNASKTSQSSIRSTKGYFSLYNHFHIYFGPNQPYIQLLRTNNTLEDSVVSLKSYLHLVSTLRMYKYMTISPVRLHGEMLKNMYNVSSQSHK
jgi:hypothetical protein